LVALLLAVAGYKASGAGRRWFAVGAGIVLGLGVMTKLLSVVAALPIAFLLLAGGVRGRATNLVMAVVAGLFAIVLVLLPFLGSWPTVYQQLVGMHVAATDLSNVSSSVQVFRLTLNTEWPLVLLAAAGTAVLVIRRSSLAIALLIWGSASFVLLVTHKPLFLHHMVYLVPALVLIPVAAIRPSLELLTASPNIVRGWPAAVASCLVAVMAFGWLVGFVQARNAATASVRSAAVARLLASASQPGDFVVTDNQYVAALANRDVPTQLVDTSRVRIESGNLDASLLERVTLASGARIILFDTDRLDRVRGFRDWVAQRFHLVDDVGGGTWLYRR
jgi:4-amino-4-deoxy-L-arabinose transferase-like glycosyltransferase